LWENAHAKFQVYRGNVSPLRGEAIFGPLSKNNTGMAALCVRLPIMTRSIAWYLCENPLRNNRWQLYTLLSGIELNGVNIEQ